MTFPGQPPSGWQQPPDQHSPPYWQTGLPASSVPPRARVGPLGCAGIGCGGLVAVALILGIAGAAASSPGSGGGSTAAAGSAPQATVQPVQAGQVARDGDFAFRYRGMRCGRAAARAVYHDPGTTGRKPAGTRECIIRLRVTDARGLARSFLDSDQYAYDAGGHRFTADVNGMLLAGDQDGTQLRPGASIRARVAFSIPSGDSISRLVLHDSEHSGGVTIRI